MREQILSPASPLLDGIKENASLMLDPANISACAASAKTTKPLFDKTWQLNDFVKLTGINYENAT